METSSTICCFHAGFVQRLGWYWIDRVQQRIGYAWRAIIDHMYRERGDDITENLTDCPQTIARLAHNLKD
jgi:hypothetical protein